MDINKHCLNERQRATVHSQTCLKALTLPSPLATTPFLLTTLQLACLKVAGFRGQAHTNHRYALFCSASRPLKISTSCLSHTYWLRALSPLSWSETDKLEKDGCVFLRMKINNIFTSTKTGSPHINNGVKCLTC